MNPRTAGWPSRSLEEIRGQEDDITHDQPQRQESLDFYASLIKNASVPGNQMPTPRPGRSWKVTVLTASAAANDLPDLIGALSLNGTSELLTDEMLDADAAARILTDLGADTFSKRALELTSAGGRQLAVPSDGFAQLLS